MSTLLHRIKEIADSEGITIGFLEKQIGASKGVLSRAIRYNTDIQAKWLELIVYNYPSYSAAWLLTGEGSKSRLKEFSKIYPESCERCLHKEVRISDLLETISSLKETNMLLREMLDLERGNK